MMTNKDFIQMMVSERIHILLGRKMTPKEREILDRGEQIIKGLNEEEQTIMEEYMNQMVKIEAAAEEKAYLGGVKDGICLVLGIFKTWWTEYEREPEKAAGTDVLKKKDEKGCTEN